MNSSDEDDDGPQTPEREALNISNDQFYQPKTNCAAFKPTLDDTPENLSIPKYGSPTIQHSLPAYDLWLPFYPTYIGEEKFRNFHRPKLRHYRTGPQAHSCKPLKPFPLKNLTRSICRFQMKLRAKIIGAINSGLSRKEVVEKFLLIRDAKDLTAKKGDLILFEYCEEFPPVLSQIGMAANVKTLIMPNKLVKPTAVKTTHRNSLNPSPTTPPTARTNAVNKNALILSPNSRVRPDDAMNVDGDNDPLDNLAIQLRKSRVLRGNYNIGFDETITIKHNHPSSYKQQVYFKQLEPGERMQVIENNLYRAPIFEHEMPSCDFLVLRTRNSFYIRGVQTIFTVGQTMPLLQIPEPTNPAFQRFRADLSNRYIHKLFQQSDTEPPSINIEELESLFPDYMTGYLKQRLRKNGCQATNRGSYYATEECKYGLETLLEHRAAYTPERYCLNMSMLAARQRLRELNYTESMINPSNDVELETEVLAAPWNTSKALHGAMMGRHYLDFKSHLIDPTGPQREGFSCVPWVRSPLEAEQHKAMQQSTGQANTQTFSLKNPLAHQIIREKQSRLAVYQNEAKHISKIQSSVLSSREELSTDEDDEDYGDCEIRDNENLLDSSFDEQLRDLDRMIIGNRTVDELNFEKEEEERRQMLKDFNENERNTQNEFGSQASQIRRNELPQINTGSLGNKVLKITRIYDSPDGKNERIEIVREPKIIALYMQQKSEIQRDGVNSESIRRGHRGSAVSNEQFNRLIDSPTTTLNRSLNIPRSNASANLISNHRRSSLSLGPSELCRAEGLVLTISKTVLDSRGMRKRRRDHTNP